MTALVKETLIQHIQGCVSNLRDFPAAKVTYSLLLAVMQRCSELRLHAGESVAQITKRQEANVIDIVEKLFLSQHELDPTLVDELPCPPLVSLICGKITLKQWFHPWMLLGK